MRRKYRKKRKNKKKIYGRGSFKKIFETIKLLNNDGIYKRKFFNF